MRDGVERRFSVLLDTRIVLGASLDSLAAHVLAVHAARVEGTRATAAAVGADGAPRDALAARPAGGLSYAELFRDTACPRPSRWFALPRRAPLPLVMVLSTLRCLLLTA